MRISGHIIDLFQRRIFDGEILVEGNRIIYIKKCDVVPDQFIMPGIIDSHVHVESTMLTPSRFAHLIVPRGTVGVVTDPHEIANVVGVKGVDFMIKDSKHVPVKFFFGAPSCVPATAFETSGAVLDSKAIEALLKRDDIWFLSEMMNFPGVVFNDKEVWKKIKLAHFYNKPIDGHAPGLKGSDLRKYAGAGISTDHECAFLDEALQKIEQGMMIQIREGSAARNFESLYPLFDFHPDKLMLCTDDSHPDQLLNEGHIDRLLRLGVEKQINIFDLLRAATVNPVQHYGLPVGLLREGDSADFVVVKDLKDFKVLQTWIEGSQVYDAASGVLFDLPVVEPVNSFRTQLVDVSKLRTIIPDDKEFVKVIDVTDGELLTQSSLWKPILNESREIQPDIKQDILKLVVVNRYTSNDPMVGFVRNLGLKSGAIGGTVAHDSHNIIVAGVDDESILAVINGLIQSKGGIASYDKGYFDILPLPVGGLMSTEDGEAVALKYQQLNNKARQMGAQLKAPFMSLAFLSLLVIPSLKLGDKGLFDVDKFCFTSLFE
jgi:adenine deaminase